MSLYKLSSILQGQFLNQFELKMVRPNKFQVLLPYYHADGDMFEIYLETADKKYIIQDMGLTLMRLSYDTEIDTDGRRALIQKILDENQIKSDEGNLYVVCESLSLIAYLMSMVDAISRISALRLMARGRSIRNPFYENFTRFMTERFARAQLIDRYVPPPVPFADDYLAPLAIFHQRTLEPICIFPIASNDRCDQVTITVQHYRLSKFHPMLIGVYENMEELSPKKTSKVTNLLDKQFSYFEQNERTIEDYLTARSA
jgi:hypothetical protein